MMTLKLLLLIAAALPAFGQGWTQLTNTKIQTVCESANCEGVFAYSGATMDTQRNRLIIWGGGHGDYNGNEVYALYLSGTPSGIACTSSTAPAMCRIKAGTPGGNPNLDTCPSALSDGNPNGRHTYDDLAYIANADRMVSYNGSLSCHTGANNKDLWTLNLGTLAWTAMDPVSGSPQPSDYYSGPNSSVTYDPSTRLTYIQITDGYAFKWSYPTNTYTRIDTTIRATASTTSVLDPRRKYIYYIGSQASSAGDATASAGAPAIYARNIGGSDFTLLDWTGSTTGCSGLASAMSPGLAFDPKTGYVVGWPNFGNTVYIFNPDTKVCTTQTFSGGPPDSANLGGQYTSGTYGRFTYSAPLDAFVVVNHYNSDAYLLRLRPTPNSIQITNNGSTTTNYPVQIGRPFVQGEIPNGSLPQASVDGVAVGTQADVKSRWPDNSLKHAVVSFVVPTFTAGQTYTVTFAAGTTTGNTALTKAQMLDAAYNFDAVISLTKSGVTKTASARTMLNADDYTVWASGPTATTILLGNHAQSTTCGGKAASTYDFGFASYCAFRPMFEATFWPTTHQVWVRYIGEIANTEQREDVAVDSMSLTIGSASPSTVYTRATALTMNANTRWTKRAWLGGTPPAAGINHNVGYLAQTKFLPNYNTFWSPSSSALTTLYSGWTSASKDLYDAGLYEKGMPAPGARSGDEIGHLPQYVVQWLYTGDYRAQEVSFGQADLAGAWPIYWREGDATKKLDRGGSVSGVGRVMSVSNRQAIALVNGTSIPAAVGTVAATSWTPDVAHQPDWQTMYAVSGDYYYLEENWFWAGWSTAYAYGTAYSGDEVGRGPTGAEGHMSSFVSVPYQIRGTGWGFRNRTETAFMSPDAAPEKAYFEQLIADTIASWEGERNITGSSYQGNTMWTWANQFAASTNPACYRVWCNQSIAGTYTGVPSSIHFWIGGSDGFNDVPESNAYIVAGASLPAWETNVVIYALGRARELGYPTDRLVAWVAPYLISQATDAGYNPWLLGAYRVPTKDTITGQYFTSWSQVKAQMCTSAATGCYADASAQTATTFEPPINKYTGAALNPRGDGIDGVPYFAGAALSMLVDQSNGQTAWNFINQNAMSDPSLNDNPKFAIVPRAGISAQVCSITPTSAGPYTAGQSVSQAFTASNCTAGSWSATGLSGSGLSLNSSTGLLTGTAVAGTYSAHILYDTADQPMTVTINASGGSNGGSKAGGKMTGGGKIKR